MPRSLAILFVAAVISGCSGTSAHTGGQTGEETVGCLPVSSRTLAVDEASPLGFSAADVLTTASGPHGATLTWAKGGDTPVTVNITARDGVIEYQDREWRDDGSGTEEAPAIGASCPDVVVIPVRLELATEDGAFDEVFDISLEATAVDTSSAWLELDLDALAGTYTVTEVDPSQYEEVSAFLSVQLAGAAVHGSVDGQATGTSGEVAFADNFSIAQF